ncbi:MAG: zinc-ribbon domain-containing protein [Eubacteriales bacterium]
MESGSGEKICPSCGKAISADTAFCNKCGYKFSKNETSEGENQ